MKKMVLGAWLILTIATSAMAEEAIVGKHDAERDSTYNSSTIVAIAVAPVTIPVNFLAAPYQGMKEIYRETNKIQDEMGRNAVRFAMAPFWIPAAVLNIPSALLAPIGLTTGF